MEPSISKTILLGSAGGAVTVTGGKLDVNVAPAAGGATEAKQDTQITQTTNLPTAINNESIWLLRRIVKLLEASSTVDSSQRQRVTIDMLPGNVATLPTYTAAATLANVTTVAAVTTLNQIAGDDARYVMMDLASVSYGRIRDRLTW